VDDGEEVGGADPAQQPVAASERKRPDRALAWPRGDLLKPHFADARRPVVDDARQGVFVDDALLELERRHIDDLKRAVDVQQRESAGK
ncbi:hypothetical protein BT094_12120, partial [Corynebacterium diphtheriae]